MSQETVIAAAADIGSPAPMTRAEVDAIKAKALS
jgi:hypothetical protein